jgi:hypothetical protein
MNITEIAQQFPGVDPALMRQGLAAAGFIPYIADNFPPGSAVSLDTFLRGLADVDRRGALLRMLCALCEAAPRKMSLATPATAKEPRGWEKLFGTEAVPAAAEKPGGWDAFLGQAAIDQ